MYYSLLSVSYRCAILLCLFTYSSIDHKVYIFNRSKETPVEVLSGHIRTVNSVAWNPHFPQLLVSASDDGTLRLWGPDTSCGIPSEPNISIDGSSGSIGRADVSTADVSGKSLLNISFSQFEQITIIMNWRYISKKDH